MRLFLKSILLVSLLNTGCLASNEIVSHSSVNKALHLNINYPLLSDTTESATYFNQEMMKFIKTFNHNYIHTIVTYDAAKVRVKNNDYVTVRFHIEKASGGAHPLHEYYVFNYNFTKGKEMTLAEFLKTNSMTLENIATFSALTLNKKMGNNPMIAEGTKATFKNYKNWTIKPNGILITFEEYQVAPYAVGAQEVLVPYLVRSHKSS